MVDLILKKEVRSLNASDYPVARQDGSRTPVLTIKRPAPAICYEIENENQNVIQRGSVAACGRQKVWFRTTHSSPILACGPLSHLTPIVLTLLPDRDTTIFNKPDNSTFSSIFTIIIRISISFHLLSKSTDYLLHNLSDYLNDWEKQKLPKLHEIRRFPHLHNG